MLVPYGCSVYVDDVDGSLDACLYSNKETCTTFTVGVRHNLVVDFFSELSQTLKWCTALTEVHINLKYADDAVHEKRIYRPKFEPPEYLRSLTVTGHFRALKLLGTCQQLRSLIVVSETELNLTLSENVAQSIDTLYLRGFRRFFLLTSQS